MRGPPAQGTVRDMFPGILRPYDREALREKFQNAVPFPHLVLEDFLESDFAQQCQAEYPGYAEARAVGNEFAAVNERLKVQVCDSTKFKPNVLRLHEVLASQQFLDDLAYITGIPKLLADPRLDGGGMHVMGGSGGRLDVHVDFNYSDAHNWHRRLNILVYLNPVWEDSWGGALELWNKDVTQCFQSVAPRLGRCVIFETSDISYHGVTPLTAPREMTRKSYAAYYYTAEAPAGWKGTKHDTVFRPRPSEKLRSYVMAPAERASRFVFAKARGVGSRVRRLLGN